MLGNMAKRKGLTVLLDEDMSANLVQDLLLWKGYSLEIALKGENDHFDLRTRLRRRPKPLFLTRDKGWLTYSLTKSRPNRNRLFK